MKILKRKKPAEKQPTSDESIQKADKHAISIAYSIMKRARAKAKAEPK